MSGSAHGMFGKAGRARAARLVLACWICGAASIVPAIDARASAFDAPSQTGGPLWWVNAGVGGASVRGGLGDAGGGISFGVSASYCRGWSLISARGVVTTEIQIDIFGTSGPPAKVGDIGLLYGVVTRSPHALASFSAGAGLVLASDGGSSSTTAFGVPFECQLVWKPAEAAGFGLYGFANANSEHSFAGVLLCLQFGRHMR